MPLLYKYCIFSLLFLQVAACFSQKNPQGSKEGKEITITADLEQIDEEKYPGAIVMRKGESQVYIQHEGIEMWCDLAFFYKEDNFVKAYNNVRLNQGDTLSMNSRYAEYDGDTQFAYAAGEVDMTSPTANLTTDTLYFDRVKQQAFYRSGGTLRDTASVVTSKVGRYFMDQEKYSFIQNVVLTNPDYVINSQQLDFYSESGHAYLYGPSTITSETSTVYCERGFYDTHENKGYFVKNSRIDYEHRRVYGDSLYFERETGFASATNNIRVVDTVNHSVIKGHYAEVYREKDSVLITKRAVAITKQENDSVQNDSIYIHGDRLLITGKPEERIIRAYPNVRIFKTDLSGKSDSLHSNQKNGLTQMLGRPILWNVETQMTGDTIYLISNPETEKLDSLKVFNNAFVAQKDTIPLSRKPETYGYNQLKGDVLYGLFRENKIYQIDIIKNAESIMYYRSEAGELQGIDKSVSASIAIALEDNAIREVTKFRQFEGKSYPLSKFPVDARTYPGLNWRGDERMIKMEDIFEGDPPYELTKIEGIPLPEIPEDFFAEPENEEEDDENLDIPAASELRPTDLKNREEDAPEIGTPVNEKATIKKDSLMRKEEEKIRDSLPMMEQQRDSISKKGI